MSRPFSILIYFIIILAGQLAALGADSSPLQLVYLQDGTTLTTYNVDPQTLSATQVGQPVNLPLSSFALLTPSLNGRFLYIRGTDSSQRQHLWIFATDASGVPQNPPVQTIDANGMFSFDLNPGVNFAYSVLGLPNSQNQTIFSIERFAVDPNTGVLSAPTIVARYPPNGSCSPGSEGSSFSLNGFSPNGKALYDDWYCFHHGDVGAIYYARPIDPQTGALGPETKLYTWTSNSEGYDSVTFLNNQIIDFSIPNPFGQGVNSLSIYPLVPNSKAPLVQCSASMLEACGYSIGALVHPSGKYVFFTINYYTDQIARIDLPGKKLIDTTHYIPFQVSKFNPNGTIVYALSVGSSTYDVEIYGFNPQNADVTTTGSSIHAPSIADTFWPVQRE
jgi:hypothetical protein